MRKAIWILAAVVALGAAGWKIGDLWAGREAEEKQLLLKRQKDEQEAEQLANARQKEERWAAYLNLVAKAASGHLRASQATELEGAGFDQQKRRLTSIYQAQAGAALDNRLRNVWADARRYAGRGLLILYRIDS